jgi:hypothetical protein
MDRRRLSACANFVGYIDVMGHINQPNVSIELNIYIYIYSTHNVNIRQQINSSFYSIE